MIRKSQMGDVVLWVCCIMATTVSNSNAEMMRIEFRGTVEHVGGSEDLDPATYLGSVGPGTPFFGFYRFESEATDLGQGLVPGQAVYRFDNPPAGMFVEMGGFTMGSNPADTELLITAGDNMPPVSSFLAGDAYSIASVRDTVVPGKNGLKSFRPEMVLVLNGDDDVRDGVTLLHSPGQHAAFPNATFSIQGFDLEDSQTSFLIQSGDIQFAVVPEPNTTMLIGLALLSALRFRRSLSR